MKYIAGERVEIKKFEMANIGIVQLEHNPTDGLPWNILKY